MVAELSVVVVGTQLAAPVPGGTGRYTSDLLRTLAATRPSRARLEVFPAAGSAGSSGAGVWLPSPSQDRQTCTNILRLSTSGTQTRLMATLP